MERVAVLTRTKTARTPIGLWALLVWAYRGQMVQYERDRAFAFRPAGAYAGDFLPATAARSWEGRGCINGAGTLAHQDAHVLNALVMRLSSAKRRLVMDTAAEGMPPVWDPPIEPLRVVPLWKGPAGRVERERGRVRVLGQPLRMYAGQRFPGDERRGRHEAVGCWIDYAGHTPAEAAAIRKSARQTYRFWWAALLELYRTAYCAEGFERWKISSIGVPREPWRASH
jgi:hypothetical protein